MNEVYDTTPSAERVANLKQLTMIVYVLYAVGIFTGTLTSIVAIIINYVKREDTQGTIYASHFTWQIRTFWWSLLWFIVGWATFWMLGLGFLVWAADGIWVIYRIVKGFLNWSDGKPMPVPV
ncbi:hypothetical protein LRH25_24310 [Ideonella azotifigens]|uniref:Membrane protein n=1 Tax=Ideonella azotifigens TaxID=513160 RepID=A0ABP3W0R8_9BURK|nr:hypothetical protein [Ideonella azotifigens]MCD2343456.1 hypothetical protein [Ideonella azotifigens]